MGTITTKQGIDPSTMTGAREIYPGVQHGLADTHKVKLNADLLAFLRA